MNADPAAQLRLLDLQAVDSRLDQLRHQRASLPEIAEAASLEATRRVAEDARRDARIVVDDLRAAQQRAEADVEQVRTRRARDQQRIDQGVVTNPKDLERLTGELASLERRIGVLEDEELEVMEQLEAAEAVLTEREQEVAAHDERLAVLAASRAEKTAAIDAELAQVEAQRPAAVEGLPADLMALYDRLRATKGVAAAELRARQCGGCRLTLDAAELQAIRTAAPEAVVRCEECTRILVRTAESGL